MAPGRHARECADVNDAERLLKMQQLVYEAVRKEYLQVFESLWAEFKP